MAKRDGMLEAMDQLKMLTGEGMFENKEWGGKKVAPDQQQQETRMEAMADLSTKLQEKAERLVKKEKELQEREERLNVEKENFQRESAQRSQDEESKMNQLYAEIQKKDGLLSLERDRLSNWKIALDRQAKHDEFRINAIQQREDNLNAKEAEYKARKETLGDLEERLKLALISVEEEKNESEEWRKIVVHMYERAKDDALRGMKFFVRMWKDEILTMIRQDKLRCIIPWDTTTWFIFNYYQLDSARLGDLTHWMSDYLDGNVRDILIDIDTEMPRFVIFYLQSKLEKHAAESWNGNTQNALKNMHCRQKDDGDQVDEKLKAREGT